MRLISTRFQEKIAVHQLDPIGAHQFWIQDMELRRTVRSKKPLRRNAPAFCQASQFISFTMGQR